MKFSLFSVFSILFASNQQPKTYLLDYSEISDFGTLLNLSLFKSNPNLFRDKLNRPLLLNNIFGWYSENWVQNTLQILNNETIEYDVRDNESGLLTTYEATLGEFQSIVHDNSDHYDSMYLMNEEILQKVPGLSDLLSLNETIFEKDLFQMFPTRIGPKTAIIIGGKGSRSFLHADPYEWTGWNFLAEGRKLCW